MKSYTVLINGQPSGTVEARNHREAWGIAKFKFGRRCDVIGLK